MKYLKSLSMLQIATAVCMIILVACVGFGLVAFDKGAVVGVVGAVTFALGGGVNTGVPTLRSEQRLFTLYNRVTIPAGAVSTDIIELLNIKAGTYVKNVYLRIVTAATATSISATIGDGAGANSWDASVDLKGTAGTLTAGVSGTDAYALTGKHYSAADTIDAVVTVNTMTVGAVIDVYADCIDLNA